ncbi:DUF1254 domain-containing protein [Isoptericola sp. b408]|uniref:DUF1254 domain-containing protein n=1 Tax=Isoptericola sp. b408 TaxID=3064653 RepID=UPI0027134D4F|nr:DUF1254 domain-containing protein [Isoptericola sp. b408]MDO8151973.1 DUF1254 domain-containing protein [Isoptericola sp. b408]
MTTSVPEGIATPDELHTRIGTLRLHDGVPDEETTRLVYDNLDFQRAVQAYLSSIQIASMRAMRAGILAQGPANTTIVAFESMMDSRALFLTPNTTSVYMMSWLDLSDGPLVVETPPDVLGVIDDSWFHYVADFGNAGPDRGRGGRFLVLPPGHDGEVPDGYHVVRTQTFGNWVVWRGFPVDGDPAPAVRTTRERFSIHPLGSDPVEMTMVDVSGTELNTVHRMDAALFDEVAATVRTEPPDGQDPEILGLLASIGIRHGAPFAPDARMRRILADAADVGAATVRALAARPRDEEYYLYPGERVWQNPFVGGSYEFLRDGARLLDARAYMHFYATGITPAMSMAMVGKGSQYAVAYLGADGAPLDGSETYVVHLPPDVPAQDFWSFVVYDNQTRSMLQTDQRLPGISSARGAEQNADGSFDVYFGPERPSNGATNWVQTVPGRGWNMLFRLYGPLETWFDRTWRPGDPTRIDQGGGPAA